MEMTNRSLVKNPSNFVPPMSEDKYLNIFIEATKNYHKQHATAKKSNLTRGEQNDLNEQKNDDTIIIKEADKGGATVIMNKTFYRAKVHEMLADNEHYAELTDLNYDDKIIKKIGKLLKKFHQETTKKKKEYLQNFAWKTSNFYGLPKYMKEAILQQNSTYIKVQAPPGLKLRPIVACPSSPTHQLSNFIDIVLKPLCEHVPSFIRDDLDFLNHLPETIDEDTLLVSFDVVSLYTSIPHELRLAAIEYWINNFTDSITRSTIFQRIHYGIKYHCAEREHFPLR